MSKILAAVISDTHVAPTTIASVGASGDAFYSVRQFASHVKKHAIPETIWLGDLNNRTANRSLVHSFWQEVLTSLKACRSRVNFIQGNHDEDVPPYLLAFPGTRHIHELEFSLGPLRCYGLDFLRQESLVAALGEVPEDTDFLFAHQGWKEWLGFEGAWQASLVDLPDSLAHLISGDNHKHIFNHLLHHSDGERACRCYSPGSACMTSIAEDPQKYFLTINSEGLVERVRLKTRLVLGSPLLQTADHADQFIADVVPMVERAISSAVRDELPEELRFPYLRVSYHQSIRELPRRVARAVAGRAHLFWNELRAQTQTDRTELLPLVQSGSAITPLTCLDQELDPQDRPEANALLRRLLQAPDKGAEFARWQAERSKDAAVLDIISANTPRECDVVD